MRQDPVHLQARVQRVGETGGNGASRASREHEVLLRRGRGAHDSRGHQDPQDDVPPPHQEEAPGQAQASQPDKQQGVHQPQGAVQPHPDLVAGGWTKCNKRFTPKYLRARTRFVQPTGFRETRAKSHTSSPTPLLSEPGIFLLSLKFN